MKQKLNIFDLIAKARKNKPIKTGSIKMWRPKITKTGDKNDIKKFFKENEQSVNEITAIHLFESEDPTQFMKLGGNQGCVDWLKAMLQGLPPNNNNNKKGDNNE